METRFCLFSYSDGLTEICWMGCRWSRVVGSFAAETEQNSFTTSQYEFSALTLNSSRWLATGVACGSLDGVAKKLRRGEKALL